MKELEIVRYEIVSEKLPMGFDGIKLVFLTDLHCNSYGENNEMLLRRIGEENPDYVLTGGDLIVWGKDGKHDLALMLLKELAVRYKVYSSNGNHEKKWMEYEKTKRSTSVEYRAQMEALGVCYLMNQRVYLKRGKDRICLAGLDMDLSYYAKIWKRVKMEPDYLFSLLGKKPEEFTVLMAHNPDYFNQYVHWGADLVLSGHIHGGLIIFPSWGGLISPSYQIFPQYDYGLFEKDGTRMVLSRGLGTHTIKIRINNRPEISVLTLKRSIVCRQEPDLI